MSTGDVRKYFKKYFGFNDGDGDNIKWINDSSCVIVFPSVDMAKLAYFELKLSEPREDEKLPPLNLYLQDLREMEKREKEKKEHNPDYDTLFGAPAQEEEKKPEEEDMGMEVDEIALDTRNEEVGIGFIDVIGYKLRLPERDQRTDPWQNLWIRYATNEDKKNPNTLGKDSRYYKFVQKHKTQHQQQQQNRNVNKP